MPDEHRRPLATQDEGADWLYRDVPKRVYRRVVLLVVPSDAPKRVRIQHLDPEMRGTAEWVPAARLEVPWEARGVYLVAVDALHRLQSHAPKTLVTDLASRLLPGYIHPGTADLYYNGAGGVLEIFDVQTFRAEVGEDVQSLMGHPDSIVDDHRAFIPWPALERILVALIEADPDPAMRLLDELTREQERFDLTVDRDGPRWWMLDDEDSHEAARLRQWHERDLETIATLRRWLNLDTPSLAESYIELRGMYTDLAAIVQAAIPRVQMDRSQKSARLAKRMAELLDRPLPIVDVRGVRLMPDDEGYPDPLGGPDVGGPP
ncbi:hypothetical protein AB0230_05035 [Microbacterium sp. NPDC089190]|uniref:hypothetical protein n=1 Tax=Microbacterium sp. NPDC089190 TaxID=3155063 RepID=UPI00344B93B5